MPRYKKRDPEFTAIQFTGSNIREILDELGPGFSTIYQLDIQGATNFELTGYSRTFQVDRGNWIVVDHDAKSWHLETDWEFERNYAPVKRVGRPPKEKK